jgi:hypothetical protein
MFYCKGGTECTVFSVLYIYSISTIFHLYSKNVFHSQTCAIIFFSTKYSSISFQYSNSSPSLRLDTGALPGVRLTVGSSHTTRKSATYFSHAIPLRPVLAASGLFIFIIRGGCCIGHSFLLVPPFD